MVDKTYHQLDGRLRRWIADQRMFFVAAAPSGSFRFEEARQAAWRWVGWRAADGSGAPNRA